MKPYQFSYPNPYLHNNHNNIFVDEIPVKSLGNPFWWSNSPYNFFRWFNGETVDLHNMKPLVLAPGRQGREGELEELGQAAGSRACRGHRVVIFGT